MSEYIMESVPLPIIRKESQLVMRGEIVRCRDCEFFEAIPEDAGHWCGYWTDRVYGSDGFCAWGKRREP